MKNNHKIEIFQNQVMLLSELFVIDNQMVLEKLNDAVQKFCYFTFEMDKLIDGEKPQNKLSDIIISHQKSIQLLGNLFEEKSQFWDKLHHHTTIYFDILAQEKIDAQKKPNYNLSDFENYAIAKHTLAFVPIEAMSLLFVPKCDTRMISEIFSSLFLGIQMNDDLEDFSSDENTNQWTFLRSKVNEYMVQNNIFIDQDISKFTERVLYVSGIGSENLEYAKQQFLNSKKLAEEINFKTILPFFNYILEGLENNKKLINSLLKPELMN